MEKYIKFIVMFYIFTFGFILASAKGLSNNEIHYFHGRDLAKYDAIKILKDADMWKAANLIEKNLKVKE